MRRQTVPVKPDSTFARLRSATRRDAAVAGALACGAAGASVALDLLSAHPLQWVQALFAAAAVGAAWLGGRIAMSARLERQSAQLKQTESIGQFGSWRWLPSKPHDVSCSDQVFQMLGLGNIGSTIRLRDLLGRIPADDRPELLRNLRQAVTGDSGFEFRTQLRGPDGDLRAAILRGEAARTGPDTPVAVVNGVMLDVTGQQQAQKAIERLAFFDSLTALPNRALFRDRLLLALARAKRDGMPICVMYLDLDHFKNVNDVFGHPVGDQLLKVAAKRLQSCIRKSDTAARLGGDEFAIMLPELRDRTAADQVAIKVLAAMNKPFHIAGHRLHLGVSVGVAVEPFGRASADDLLRNADMALYQAKRAGRGTFAYHTAAMSEQAEASFLLMEDLHKAVPNGELFLVYQPQISLDEDGKIGFEALLRWRRNGQDVLSPSQFIPVAEQSRLIVDLGGWVLRTACVQAKSWLDQGLPIRGVSVNVSGRQLAMGNFEAEVRAALAESGLPARYLELELTESGVMDTHRSRNTVLDRLRGLGVTLCIDDFGTGYSSLQHLKGLPVHRLKIAQDFVRTVLTDAGNAEIVRATVGLAHFFGLSTIAEGVETEAQLAFLRDAGAEMVQGYYYAAPLEPAAVPNWLTARGLDALPLTAPA